MIFTVMNIQGLKTGYNSLDIFLPKYPAFWITVIYTGVQKELFIQFYVRAIFRLRAKGREWLE